MTIGCREKKLLLLVHGWPLSLRKMYEYQIERLSDRDTTVVVDLRGFGVDAPARGYSYRQMATDLYRVVRCKSSFRISFWWGFCGRRHRFALYESVPWLTGKKVAPFLQRQPHAGHSGVISLWPKPRIGRQPDPAGGNRLVQLARQFSHEQLFACPQSEAAKNWFEDISLFWHWYGSGGYFVARRGWKGRP